MKIHQHGCQPPASLPRKDPIFGIDVAFRMFQSYRSGQRSASFKAQHEQYGSTFQSVALGKTRIFTIDPANLRAIFSTNFHDWGVQPLRLGPWGPMLGKGVMNMDGSFWKHSRDMVQPLFRREQAFDLVAFDRHVARLLELLPRHGETVDLQPLFARLILDFTTEFLFGECCDCLTPNPNEDAVRFLDAFHYGQAAIGKRTQLPYLSIFTTDKKFWRAVKTVQDFVGELVDHAALRCSASSSKEEADGPSRKRYVLADELLRTHSDATDIRNQLLNTFLAAHDTTAVLMTNVFFHLARHPAVYAKLRAELAGVDPASLANPDTIKSLPYLHQVVIETSRLTPVVGQSARMALRDTILPSGGGTDNAAPVHVSAGTSVQFNFFALHRRETLFGPDAGEYRPERWEEGAQSQVGHWDFLPFIGGPRTCPAQEMAMLQVKYVVARMAVGGGGQQGAFFPGIRALENRDECWEFVERYRITADSKNGCKVALSY
ncbi:MAG: hypothetical protein Q9214_000178 [Letrouitia sp. 1 TL-2023]